MKICTPFITKNGVRLYASTFGKKAFCFDVTEEQHKAYLEKKAAKAEKQLNKKTKDK
ncbi:hypothetical protein ABER02_18195 [Rossellomorea marisflavi]|uniref:hypothetical protein n=1 Tax=Rossellomorea marisflavi TaxID=189381 RepID=UPI003D277E1F